MVTFVRPINSFVTKSNHLPCKIQVDNLHDKITQNENVSKLRFYGVRPLEKYSVDRHQLHQSNLSVPDKTKRSVSFLSLLNFLKSNQKNTKRNKRKEHDVKGETDPSRIAHDKTNFFSDKKKTFVTVVLC